MGSPKIWNPTLPLLPASSRSDFPGKPDSLKMILKLGSSTCFGIRRFRVCCAVKGGDNQSNGEEPPESLFMKELKRRGMTPTSLLESSSVSGDEMKVGEEFGKSQSRNAVSTESEKRFFNQRETSMQLNSEGLEGLVPQAKLLLTIGGTFFLGFGPLIIITISFFWRYTFTLEHLSSMMQATCQCRLPNMLTHMRFWKMKRISQTATRIN